MNKFLGFTSSGDINLLDGTASLSINSITLKSITDRLPLRTNASGKVVSANVAISEVTGLQTTLDDKIEFNVTNDIEDCNGLISETAQDLDLVTLDSTAGIHIDSATGNALFDADLLSRTILPTTDATYDIGSTSFKFKDIYGSGILYADDRASVNRIVNGIVDPDEVKITYDDGSLEFKIEPVSSSYQYYYEGVLYTKTGAETVNWTDVDGAHYFYYVNGVLTHSTSAWNILTTIPINSIYWNATSNDRIYTGYELHGCSMSKATHSYLHNTMGTRYAEGLELTFVLGDGSADADAECAVTAGVIYDDDIRVDIVTPASAANFSQTLSPIAQIPVYYQLSSGIWSRATTTAYPVYVPAGVVQYNLDTAGTWSLEDVTNNYFIAMWIFATNDVDEPVIAMMGQGEEKKESDAEDNFIPENISFGVDFPVAESKLLWRLIIKCNSGYANTPKCFISSSLDYRASNAVPGSSSTVTSHNALSGRDVANTHPALSIATDVTNFDSILSGAGNTQVQACLETIDEMGKGFAIFNASADTFLQYGVASSAFSMGVDTSNDFILGEGTTLANNPIFRAPESGNDIFFYRDIIPNADATYTLGTTSNSFDSLWLKKNTSDIYISNAGNSSSGADNIGIGSNSLASLTTGSKNVAIGDYTLNAMSNTNQNYNVGIGGEAMRYVTNTSDTVAIGYLAGYYGTSRGASVFIGSNSGKGVNGVTDSSNSSTAVGANSLFAITTGTGNSCVGQQSLFSCTSGDNNACLGNLAGGVISTGSQNTCVGGLQPGLSIGTGDYNVCLGSGSNVSAAAASNQIAIGYSAVATADNTCMIGDANLTAVMPNASATCSLGTSANTFDNLWLDYGTGSNNISISSNLYAIDAGATSNIAIGSGAQFEVTDGKYRVAIGQNAMNNIEGGDDNTAVGYSAMKGSGGASENSQCCAFGSLALEDIFDAADDNTAIGYAAMRNITTGSDNTALGSSTGASLTSGSDCIFIGKSSDTNSATSSNRIVIGNSATGITDNTCMLGDTNLTAVMPNAGATCSLGTEANPFDTLWVEETVGEDNVLISCNASNLAAGANNNILISNVAGYLLSTGDKNICLGRGANASNTTGDFNITIGSGCARGDAVTPWPRAGNVLIGNDCAFLLQTGDYNVAAGFEALHDVTTGSNNNCIGYQSGDSITTGNNNNLMGYQAGNTITSGTTNTVIGHLADVDSATAISRIAIGVNSVCSTDNTCSIGDTNITAIAPGSVLGCTLGESAHRFNQIVMDNLTTISSGAISAGTRVECKDDVIWNIDTTGNKHPSTVKGHWILRSASASGTDGGTFTQDAWQTRTLSNGPFGFADIDNTNVTRSGNVITIQPGAYVIEGNCAAFKVDGHVCRLRDVSAASPGTDDINGMSAYSGASDDTMTRSLLDGYLVLTAARDFEMQHYCSTTRATDGFGKQNPSGAGVGNIWVNIEIMQIY